MIRAAILISGRGSNMAALLDAALPVDFRLVLSNVPDAGGLAAADRRGVRTQVVPHAGADDASRQAHEAAIDRALREAGVELVCLAGYMRRLTPFLVGRWAMLNIHPSLLPAFPGLHTHAQALKAGVAVHGCTVHRVTDRLDAGPILAQAAVPVLPGDTEASLAARVLAQEHRLYPAAVAACAGARARTPGPDAALLNPLPLPPPPGRG